MATALTAPVSGVVERVTVPAPTPIPLVPTPVSVSGGATASISLPGVLAASVPVTATVSAAVPVSRVVATAVSVLATVPYISISPPGSVIVPFPFPVLDIPPSAPVSRVVAVGPGSYPISAPAPVGVMIRSNNRIIETLAQQSVTLECRMSHSLKLSNPLPSANKYRVLYEYGSLLIVQQWLWIAGSAQRDILQRNVMLRSTPTNVAVVV